MSCRSHRHASLLVALLGVALLFSPGSLAKAQTVSGEVAVDHRVATALEAMALWDGAPGVFVDLGYGADGGVFLWTGQVNGADGLFRLSHVLHVPGFADVEDSMAYRDLVGRYRRAFTDLLVTVDDVIHDGNTVVLRWTMEGTHTGNFAALAPTGAPFRITGVTIFRTANGQIAETWFMPDALGLVTQLAADPVT